MNELNPLALDALKNHQRQLDADGCEVGVSRQALEELIGAYETQATLSRRASPSQVATANPAQVTDAMVNDAIAKFLNDPEWTRGIGVDDKRRRMRAALAAIGAGGQAVAIKEAVDRDEIIRLMREEFDPRPNYELPAGEWDDNAEDVADKIIAATMPKSPSHISDAWRIVEKWLAAYEEEENTFSRYRDDVILDGIMTAGERRKLSTALAFQCCKGLAPAAECGCSRELGVGGQAMAVKPLTWEEDHGIAGMGPYRLFKAETPLGRFVYGTDAEGSAYYHTASSGVMMVGDEAKAKQLAEAAWQKAALAEVDKFVDPSALSQPHPADERVVEALRQDVSKLLEMIDNVQSRPRMESKNGIYHPNSPMAAQVEKIRSSLAKEAR